MFFCKDCNGICNVTDNFETRELEQYCKNCDKKISFVKEKTLVSIYSCSDRIKRANLNDKMFLLNDPVLPSLICKECNKNTAVKIQVSEHDFELYCPNCK